MTLTDEQRNQLQATRDELELMESSARVFITMMDKLLSGEITDREYERFVDDHDHLLDHLEL